MQLKIFILTTLIFQVFMAIGQKRNEIKGTVLNSNQNPIPYATIRLLNSTAGTIANTEGRFTLYHDAHSLDTLDTLSLQINSLGYEHLTINIPKDSMHNNVIAILSDSMFSLPEVIVSPIKYKEYIAGNNESEAKSHVKFKIDGRKSSNLGSCIGKQISVKKGAFLNEVSFFLKENDFSDVKFRVNILDENFRLLFPQDIIVEVRDQKTGWISQRLDNINVPTKFILAIEWIESSGDGSVLNMPMKIPKFGSKHYYKFGANQEWKKFRHITSSIFVKYFVQLKK